MQKLSRREALRGTGVAALAAGAAVVPFVGALAVAPGIFLRSPGAITPRRGFVRQQR